MRTTVTHQTEPLSLVGRLALGVEILGIYIQVRVRLRRKGLTGVVEDLRRPTGAWGFRPVGDAATQGRRLGQAVVLTLGRLPVDSRCLTSSLVLLRILARRSLTTQLVIAVREPAEGLGVDAHAWIEHDGQALLWPGEPDYQRLLTL